MRDKRKSNKQDITEQLRIVDTKVVDGVFIYTSDLTISKFAAQIKRPIKDVVSYFFKQGKMYNINHVLDENQITELCLEFGLDMKKESQVDASNFMEEVVIIDDAKNLKNRPPIITIMGHVDHGKTTLIDYIRKSNVRESESGGITQHVGAYQVSREQGEITFLDTPGHAAFSLMRSRGAHLTDIVVLVVAADDGVMPQTREAVDHARAAEVPIIVFVNKMDKENADLEKVRTRLAEVDVISEKWGGNVQFVAGSAKTGDGIDKLFDSIQLEAEMLELKANPDRMAIGIVVESKVDRGQGVISTVIVQNGTLLKRDFLVAGPYYGRIKSMKNSRGQEVNKTLPGLPAVITGLSYAPKSGQKFFAFQDEKFAKKLATEKKGSERDKDLQSRIPLQIEEGKKVFNIIVKADVQGTAEALAEALKQLKNEDAQVNVIRFSVGDVSKSDIILAQASNATIYTFNIRPGADVKAYAADLKVQIRYQTIIYKIIEEVQLILKGMMAPKYEETVIGRARVLKVISASKIGNIAGSVVENGFVKAKAKVRVLRRGELIHEGYINSLQRGSDQVKRVENGREFGCHISKFDDIAEDDILEFLTDVEVAR